MTTIGNPCLLRLDKKLHVMTLTWGPRSWKGYQKLPKPWSLIVPSIKFILQIVLFREQKQNYRAVAMAETDWKHKVAPAHRGDLKYSLGLKELSFYRSNQFREDVFINTSIMTTRDSLQHMVRWTTQELVAKWIGWWTQDQKVLGLIPSAGHV